MKFFSKDSLCEEGTTFLSDRGINIPVAQQMGVASENGEIAFPYIFNGKIVCVKYRNMNDKKKMRFHPKTEDLPSDFKRPFWNQNKGSASDYLIVTEGELDAIALAQLGANNVASVPSGASSAASVFRNHYAYLQEFELIYLAFDMDEAGEKAVEEVKKILPPQKFRRIVFPVKDANDWIMENPYLELSDLEHLMRNASKIFFDEAVHFKHLPRTFFEERNPGVKTGWRSLDRFLTGIRPKELTVVSADTGMGKTTFCINLLCNLLKQDRSGFWINSWEMDYEVVVRKVASVVLAKAFRAAPFSAEDRSKFIEWMEIHNAYINPKMSKADIPTLYKQLDFVSRVYGVKYILLDHLDYIRATPKGKGKEKDNHQRIEEVICALHEMAMEFDVHIFLISHTNQSVGSDRKAGMHQLKGSSSIKQYADNVLMLNAAAKEEGDQETDNRIIVSVQKNRFFGRKGEATLRYLTESDAYIDNFQIITCGSEYEN